MAPMDPKQLKAFANNKKSPMPPKKDGPPAAPPPDDEQAETDGVDNDGGSPGDGDVSTDEQLAQDVVSKVADGDVDEELVELVGKGEAVDGTFPWVKDPDIWKRAQEALDPDDIPQAGTDGNPLDPFVVLAHVYMAMGGRAEGLEDEGSAGDEQEGGDEGAEGATPPPAAAPPAGGPPSPAAPKPPVKK